MLKSICSGSVQYEVIRLLLVLLYVRTYNKDTCTCTYCCRPIIATQQDDGGVWQKALTEAQADRKCKVLVYKEQRTQYNLIQAIVLQLLKQPLQRHQVLKTLLGTPAQR